MKTFAGLFLSSVTIVFCVCVLAVINASAHCDTLDGPVVKAARAALEKGDVTPVLKWVEKDYEDKVKAAFAKTLAVRDKGPEAMDLADMYFFETVVRLHRAGEGAPYTGLEPAGTDLGPAVAGADKALENGSVDGLVKLLGDSVATGVHEKFMKAYDAKKHADESVEAGRRYVDAYVEFVHYVERLDLDAAGSGGHHAEPEAGRHETQHAH